jgi:prepilin-type N-terminal cleavage/methylation domain-containing protein
MMPHRSGFSLLELLVCLTLIAVVASVLALSGLAPQTEPGRRQLIATCSTAAIRDRRTVTHKVDSGFVVCHPDGRVFAGQHLYLTPLYDDK